MERDELEPGRARARERLAWSIAERTREYAVITTDLEGLVTTWNPGAERIIGWEESEIAGRPAHTIFTPEDRASGVPEREMQQALERGYANDERWHIRRDGTRFFARGVLEPLTAEDGTTIGFMKILRDETQRAEEAAERERRWAESMRLAAVNRELARSLEPGDVAAALCRAARDLTGADGATFVLPVDSGVLYVEEDAIAPLWKGRHFPIDACLSGWAIEHHERVVVEDVLADPRPAARAYQATFVRGVALLPVRLHDPIGVLGLYWAEPHMADERELGLLQALADLADIALTNAQLYERMKCARDAAETANGLKDEFLATVSHELRTPLNAILGWAKLLRSGTLAPHLVGRALEVVERNAEAQARLIEDLLDVSRIIGGKVQLDIQPVAVLSFVEAAVEAQIPAASAKGIRIEKAIDPNAGIVAGDPVRLQQVVWNLLSNAVKFTPAGGRVEVRAERAGANVHVTVADTGRGIDPAFLPYVFDRFRQADATAARRHGGLGLGLAIVRHLVEQHGGTVHATSEGRGMGSTFTVTLPAATSRQREKALHPLAANLARSQRPPRSLEGTRVLVVDDEADARDLLQVALGQYGADVVAADSAESALLELSRARPDVIVSDIGMPGVDGLELMRAVRRLAPENGGAVPAVALTAYARAEDQLRTSAAGYQAHVAKPANMGELAGTIARLVGRPDHA